MLPPALALLLATGAVAEELSPQRPEAAPPDVTTRVVPGPQYLPLCAPRAKILKRLSDKYEENQRALGIQSTGLLLEIFATSNGSTWTAVTSSAQTGQSCIVASGAHWTEVSAPPVKTGDGT